MSRTRLNTRERFVAFEKATKASKFSERFRNANTVAVLAGPDVVIEAIVQRASRKSGIEMDWCYQGGRAFVQALGDARKAKSAIYCCIPQSNLSQADL